MKNYTFNENAKVTRAQFKKLIFQLTPYREVIKGTEDGKGEKKTDERGGASTEQIERGEKILLFIAETQDAIKAKLVSIFFDLTDKETEDMEFDVFDELYNIIIQKKPNLVDFLMLTPIGEKKAISSREENTLTSSAVSAEVTLHTAENTQSLN